MSLFGAGWKTGWRLLIWPDGIKEKVMLRVGRALVWCLMMLFVCGLMSPVAAQSVNAHKRLVPDSYLDDPANWLEQFVPDDQSFWDNSANWTTNYGPAYRDTLTTGSQFLACSPQFALCFHSGGGQFPCHIAPDGRSANCKCMVMTSTNYVLMTAILNRPVYDDAVKLCGYDGSLCGGGTDQAPVCNYLKGGALIPGADVISTFDPGSRQDLLDALGGKSPVTVCSKPPERLPFAGCMTAPCKLNSDGSTAQCKCPVFYGTFQLVGKGAQCSLGGDLVPSGSYIPILDTNPPK